MKQFMLSSDTYFTKKLDRASYNFPLDEGVSIFRSLIKFS
jgi:hypothetical protein